MGGPAQKGRTRTKGRPAAWLAAGAFAIALIALLPLANRLNTRASGRNQGQGQGSDRATAAFPAAGDDNADEPDPQVPDRNFGGCYDLSGMASVPDARENCLSGADTLVPANSLTAHMVDMFLSGAEVRIRRDLDGSRTLSMKGYENPDELLFLDPPAASRMPPPQRIAVARKPRRQQQPPEPPLAEKPEITLAVQDDRSAVKPPPVAAQIAEDLDLLSPEASLQLPVPRAVDGPSTLTEGSPSFERMLEGMSRSASRMECGPEGCVCAHPPCIPCPLETSRMTGVDGDTWAVRWIVWYATEATTSERFLGIRSLTGEEGELIRQAKYRWGFSTSLAEAIGRWDWGNGRIPASLVAGAGGRLRNLQAQGARLIGAGPAPTGDVQGALEIVADRTAPAAARVHALRWLAERSGDKSVRSVLRDLAASDPDESIRGVAMDALDAVATRAGGDGSPAATSLP